MIRLLISVLIILLWSACANRIPPSGGPSDITPPKLVGSIPKEGNTNVTTNAITLLFDEQVVLKNIKKELLITPRIEAEYETSVKKNTVIITLEEPLDSATTYTFNFGNSVVDITEGNPALNLVLAFSTGPNLDTLQLTGNVHDLFTKLPIENSIVGLYKKDDSLTLFNSPPYYLAKTDKSGNYTFRNLKAEEYTINAFADSNNNLICESDSEPYSFLNTTVKLDTTMISDTLKLQALNIDTLQLKRTRNVGKYFVALSNKYLTETTLKATNDSTIWYSLDKEHKEIKIYNTFTIKDSLLIELSMNDSINSHAKDSFYLKFPDTERKYDAYEVELKDLEVFPQSRNIHFKISTNKPSRFVYVDSIRISQDTLSTIQFDSTWNITTNRNNTEFELSNYLPQSYLDSLEGPDAETKLSSKPKKGKQLSYNLEIPVASFQSVESDSSEVLSVKITPKYSKDFGILLGKISTTHTHYIIQLLDKNFTPLKEITQNSSYKLSRIPPGDYTIRILIDANKNGQWDAGNILLNQLPEPIIHYKNEDGISKTTIRANWEISLNLSF